MNTKGLKTNRKILFFALIVPFLSSCSAISHTVTTVGMNNMGITQNPVVADLDVKETKVTGAAKASWPLQSMEQVKANAVADAVKNANADVLVEPKFETKSSWFYNKATVIGYPAIYKNFRPMKSEDTSLIKMGSTLKANTYVTNTPTAKHSILKVLGIVCLVVLSIAVGFGIAWLIYWL